MSDENPTPNGGGTPAGDDSTAAAAESAVAPAKKALSDEEKAAKIAAAKAKAAVAKAAAGGGEAGGGDEPPKPPWEDKPVPPEHTDATDDPDVRALAEALPGAVVTADRFAGEVTIGIPAGRVLEVCRWFKSERDFRFLVDLTAVDWTERETGRFDVVYYLHRHDDSARLRLLTPVADGVAVPSVTGVWRTAGWMEREVYDMFGIHFEGHPGLERILTWEGFNGHPLRKDFPVEGIDTGAAIYPDVFPPGGGPRVEEEKGDDQ